MDQTVMWLMMCAGSAVIGCVIGLLMTKRVREAEWRKGYADGIEVLATAIKRGMHRTTHERMGKVYLVPAAGLERVVKQANGSEK